jgi:hypothetical protein
MTVYVDDMHMQASVGSLSARWSHLMSDEPSGASNELVGFAVRLGLRPQWIQHPGTPKEHFDLTDAKRDLALRLGARAIGYGREGSALMEAKAEGRPFDLDAFRQACAEDGVVDGTWGAGGQLDLF